MGNCLILAFMWCLILVGSRKFIETRFKVQILIEKVFEFRV
jgi:hypothetical protein